MAARQIPDAEQFHEYLSERFGGFEHHHVAGIGNFGVAGCCSERPVGHIPFGARAGSCDEVDRDVLEDFAKQRLIDGRAVYSTTAQAVAWMVLAGW